MREGGHRPARGAARGDRARPPRRDDLDHRRLRRRGRPDADDAAVRQADAAPHGPGATSSAGSTTSCRCSTGDATRSASRTSPRTGCRSTRRRTPTRSSRRSEDGAIKIVLQPDEACASSSPERRGNVGTSLLAALARRARGRRDRRRSPAGRPRWTMPKASGRRRRRADDLAPLLPRRRRRRPPRVADPARRATTRRLRAVNVEGSRARLRRGRAGRVPARSSTPRRSARTRPARRTAAVDESWPTDGIPTSFYSRHKAEVERMLDRFEREHPDVRVVRLRPGLIFKREAATGIRRLFAGPLLPGALLRPGLIPIVPGHRRACASRRCTRSTSARPTGWRSSRDVARRVQHRRRARARRRRAIAELLGARVCPRARARAASGRRGQLAAAPAALPARLARHGSRRSAHGPARARNELGWEPRHRPKDALRELLEGMSAGQRRLIRRRSTRRRQAPAFGARTAHAPGRFQLSPPLDLTARSVSLRGFWG